MGQISSMRYTELIAGHFGIVEKSVFTDNWYELEGKAVREWINYVTLLTKRIKQKTIAK